MLQVEYVILIAIICIVATLLIRVNTREKGQKTWREIHYANIRFPQVFIQQDVTPEAMQATIEQYEYCVTMLRKQGNKYLNPDKDVHLFTWLADDQHAVLDFFLWKAEADHASNLIKEDFAKEKAAKAPTPVAAARAILGAQNDETFNKNQTT